MTERRFTEAEVAAILERAARTDAATSQRQLTSGEGLTLAELQDIGRQVGIAPETIRSAAAVVSRGGLATSRRFLGLPVGVGRTVDLGRKLTDDEWERFVVDLRETFDARGHVRREGSLRQWTNGNLQALVEPTANGDRVRLRTTKGNARAYMMLGLGGIGLSAATLVGAAIAGILGDPGKLSSIGSFAAIGTGLLTLGAAQLPGWARQRRAQMEALAERLASMVSRTPEPDDSSSS